MNFSLKKHILHSLLDGMPLLANVWCCCEHTETREPIDENVSYFSAPILSMVWSALYFFRLPSSFFSMHSFSHRYNEFGAIEWDSNTTLIRYSKVSVLKTCSAKFQSAPTFVPICYCIHHHNVKFQGIQLFCIDIYIYIHFSRYVVCVLNCHAVSENLFTQHSDYESST